MKKTVLFCTRLFLPLFVLLSSCNLKDNESKQNMPEKKLYFPAEIAKVPEGNDYNNEESDFCFKRSLQSDNLALFWHKEYGDNPMGNSDPTRRFDPQRALNECERFYDYYVNKLKMVEKGSSVSDTFKLLIYVFGGDEATAFGGGEENVGMLWTPAVRINKEPFGALAHEMAHSFQYLSRADYGTGPMGPIMEMSAQYMLWQVYPEWMTFEKYHLDAFMKATHLAFLHPANMYHSPYILEYWSEKHGEEFFGELSRSTMEKEDPVMTYKRLNNLSQEAFNNEIYDAASRFITWDLKRIKDVAHQYANQHTTSLIGAGNGWFKIDSAFCPQNYGYNGIKLKVPQAGTNVTLEFKGIAGDPDYASVQIDKAGWRYGFLASLKDGSRVYGAMNQDSEGTTSFEVPGNTEYLWLVVSGAPTGHWPVIFRWGPPKEDDPKEEQWPYQIRLTGTSPDETIIKTT